MNFVSGYWTFFTGHNQSLNLCQYKRVSRGSKMSFRHALRSKFRHNEKAHEAGAVETSKEKPATSDNGDDGNTLSNVSSRSTRVENLPSDSADDTVNKKLCTIQILLEKIPVTEIDGHLRGSLSNGNGDATGRYCIR
ncbi:uncharacterized protein LOC117107899 [Anneissia japonica]|uniref:uncharacterized protein LOC117107899 n=1 Tax=Anneissia japonica TaxID=1529436 RepID=UPI00142565AB|nr:uncharacterized protein LOC117107899 [Anneissia japonica]